MKVPISSFVFCAAAMCQSAPDNQANQSFLLDKLQPAPSLAELARKRIQSMNLKAPLVLKARSLALAAAPKVCAIPLLNALPTESSADFKIQVLKPADTIDRMATTAGIPACK